jgi:hypothetical protein
VRAHVFLKLWLVQVSVVWTCVINEARPSLFRVEKAVVINSGLVRWLEQIRKRQLNHS